MSVVIEAVEVLYSGWGRYLRAVLRLRDGTRLAREIEDHGSAVAVLPYDPERRVALLVTQVRASLVHAGERSEILEAPAGLREGVDVEACARREAIEEAGVRLGALERVGDAWSMPGISTERMALFLAAYADADRVSAGGGLAEESERVNVHEVPLARLAALADAGALDDMKTLVLVQTLRLRRPDLFA